MTTGAKVVVAILVAGATFAIGLTSGRQGLEACQVAVGRADQVIKIASVGLAAAADGLEAAGYGNADGLGDASIRLKDAGRDMKVAGPLYLEAHGGCL